MAKNGLKLKVSDMDMNENVNYSNFRDWMCECRENGYQPYFNGKTWKKRKESD